MYKTPWLMSEIEEGSQQLAYIGWNRKTGQLKKYEDKIRSRMK